jgi:hypothetical protein
MVTGIPSSEESKFCVVVYAHTDTWYIHPFANGGDGKAWARIQGGRWTIGTVKREFPADRIATLVLRKTPNGQCSAPAKVEVLTTVEGNVGRITSKVLVNTKDEGKL